MIQTIFGMRGHGKTTLASNFLQQREKPAILLDLFCQFAKEPDFKDSRSLLRYLIKNGGAKLKKPLTISIFEEEEFNLLCKIAIEHKDLLLILDEVDTFDSPHRQSKEFKRIIHYGRHFNIDLITTSRRPHNVSRDLTSQTEIFHIFKVIEQRDLKYFEALDGRLPAKIQPLQKFEYLHFDLSNIEEKKVSPIKKPSKRNRP